VDYPILHCGDNEKYLNRNFKNQKNSLGSIFLDYRNAGDFLDYNVIVYGHNAKNGSMFGQLSLFLDEGYMRSHRDISITLPDNSCMRWQVFTAYESDVDDPLYRMDFSGPEEFGAFAESVGAPGGAARILTFSTCASGGGRDDRVIVLAAPFE
jgi:sortase B